MQWNVMFIPSRQSTQVTARGRGCVDTFSRSPTEGLSYARFPYQTLYKWTQNRARQFHFLWFSSISCTLERCSGGG
eukprot:5659399-Amphidinium_carterae.1